MSACLPDQAASRWDNEQAGQRIALSGRYTPLVPRPEGGALVSILPPAPDSPSQARRRGTMKSIAKRRRVFERDGYTCQTCGLVFEVPADPRFTPSKRDYLDARGRPKVCMLEIDHIIPRFHGGTHDEANLQALCTQCNSRKGAKI